MIADASEVGFAKVRRRTSVLTTFIHIREVNSTVALPDDHAPPSVRAPERGWKRVQDLEDQGDGVYVAHCDCVG